MRPVPGAATGAVSGQRLSCRGAEYSLNDLNTRLASPGGCLNDELIAVLLANTIRKGNRQELAVVPYWAGACIAGSVSHLHRLRPESVVRALGGRSILGRYALFIVHVQGNHWIACGAHVPILPSTPSAMAFYDSLALGPHAPNLTCSTGVNLTPMARRISEHLDSTLTPVPGIVRRWDVRMIQAPLQTNAYDCGLHAALALAQLAESVEHTGHVDLFSPPPWKFSHANIPAMRPALAKLIRDNSTVIIQGQENDNGDRLEELAAAVATASAPQRWRSYATIQAMLRQHNQTILDRARDQGWDGVMDHDLLEYLHSGKNPEWQIDIFSLTLSTAMSEFRVQWTAENIFICVIHELNFMPLFQLEHGVLTLMQRPDLRWADWCGTRLTLSLENKAEVPRGNWPEKKTLTFILRGKLYQITMLR